MTFDQSIKTCFNQYANISGRASRSEFWWFMLFVYVVYGVLYGLGAAFDSSFLSIIAGLFSLGCVVPCIAVGVRRMHDIGKGGGWICINFVPFIGSIWYIILCCQPSEPYANRFGEVPSDFGPTPDSF